ncbi:MAG: 2,3-bisphosphoglycerate-dependent phosphoglycerate mutase [Mycobacterium sp.]|jgi:2,3-bisphosphoglycerate-dependent phosphoglycerate mutase|nr:2,3-bisphosphoglycerate-dependent phosphoglycerate mutase [Mycobacterium sp.]
MSTLVLLRHGESTANADDRFGGWLDFDLTARGRDEAARAGRLIRDAGLHPAAVHTSLLRRAVDTAEIVIAEIDAADASVHRSWRLNERHYGRLQGRTRASVREEFGDAVFNGLRRSYDIAPPPSGPPGEHVDGESLADVRKRLVPYWKAEIAPGLRAGRTTLVVAHGNSLRALCMHLDDLTPEWVSALNIPTGAPLRYDLDETLAPVTPGGQYLASRSQQVHLQP